MAYIVSRNDAMSIRCDECGADASEHEMFIHPLCHRTGGIYVAVDDLLLTTRCPICEKPIVALEVDTSVLEGKGIEFRGDEFNVSFDDKNAYIKVDVIVDGEVDGMEVLWEFPWAN